MLIVLAKINYFVPRPSAVFQIDFSHTNIARKKLQRHRKITLPINLVSRHGENFAASFNFKRNIGPAPRAIFSPNIHSILGLILNDNKTLFVS